MRGLFFCIAILFLNTNVYAMSLDDKIALAKTRCAPPTSSDPVLFANEFHFGMSTEEMAEIYKKVYSMPNRLFNRVGFLKDSNEFISKDLKDHEQSTKFPEKLIRGVISQVESALRLKYVDYVFFPDMGHSHLFIPQNYYENVMSDSGPQHYTKGIETALKAEDLKVLYHTAEQLQMLNDEGQVLPDRHIQWRFYTRNPVADLNGNIEIHTNISEKGHNTVRKLEGYRYWAGFSISANANGCFPFEDASGQIQYFDLSAFSLPYDSSLDTSEF